MAFDITKLRRTSEDFILPDGSFGHTFNYTTNDDNAAFIAANHANAAASTVKVGDIIRAQIDLDGAPALKHYRVTGNTGTVVTVAAFA